MNESTIYEKLKIFFEPDFLEVLNDSHKHSGHSGSPNTGNSHFTVIIKSRKLSNLSRVEGQRLIYDVLSDEIKKGIHALSIKVLS